MITIWTVLAFIVGFGLGGLTVILIVAKKERWIK